MSLSIKELIAKIGNSKPGNNTGVLEFQRLNVFDIEEPVRVYDKLVLDEDVRFYLQKAGTGIALYITFPDEDDQRIDHALNIFQKYKEGYDKLTASSVTLPNSQLVIAPAALNGTQVLELINPELVVRTTPGGERKLRQIVALYNANNIKSHDLETEDLEEISRAVAEKNVDLIGKRVATADSFDEMEEL